MFLYFQYFLYFHSFSRPLGCVWLFGSLNWGAVLLLADVPACIVPPFPVLLSWWAAFVRTAFTSEGSSSISDSEIGEYSVNFHLLPAIVARNPVEWVHYLEKWSLAPLFSGSICDVLWIQSRKSFACMQLSGHIYLNAAREVSIIFLNDMYFCTGKLHSVIFSTIKGFNIRAIS